MSVFDVLLNVVHPQQPLPVEATDEILHDWGCRVDFNSILGLDARLYNITPAMLFTCYIASISVEGLNYNDLVTEAFVRNWQLRSPSSTDEDTVDDSDE